MILTIFVGLSFLLQTCNGVDISDFLSGRNPGRGLLAVTPLTDVLRYRNFGGPFCLHLQGKSVTQCSDKTG
jgi:hypothetical protein